MSAWIVIAALAAAGLLGGLFNAYIESEGFVLPKTETLAGGVRVFRPGFLGNMLVGAVTAVVLAAMYSPLGSIEVGRFDAPQIRLTLQSIAGAILSGIGGSRLLTQGAARRYDRLTKAQLSDAVALMAPEPSRDQSAREQ